MTVYTQNQKEWPKYIIMDPSGFYAADVNSSAELLTNSGGTGNPVAPIGASRVVITGPSGYCANVSSSACLQTTNG
jgi:hypothetical protein